MSSQEMCISPLPLPLLHSCILTTCQANLFWLSFQFKVFNQRWVCTTVSARLLWCFAIVLITILCEVFFSLKAFGYGCGEVLMYYEQYNNNQCLSFPKSWYVNHFKSKFVELLRYLNSWKYDRLRFLTQKIYLVFWNIASNVMNLSLVKFGVKVIS